MAIAENEEVMVSVIIPTYNRADIVGRAIDSVLRQTFDRYEIIVVDDGSVDDTRRVVEAGYPQVQYIYKENGGAASARNRGISEAKAELVAFLDADDVWFEDKLAKQVELMASDESASLCFTDWRTIEDGRLVHASGMRGGGGFKPSGEYAYHTMIKGFGILPSCTMVRKSLLFEHGLFNEQLPLCEDWDLFLRISAGGNVAYIDTPLIDRHTGCGNLTSRTEAWMRSSVRITEEHMKWITSGEMVVRDRDASLAALGRRLLTDGERLAYILYTSGRGAEARRVLSRCIWRAKRLPLDVLKLLIKTIIPHKFGRKIKHIFMVNG
ncbi:MAG: glycosyltransferase [Pseudodesulfovibrio sp.]|uniref:glycosyltransferase family 2 protein n=1 Tax=Pseudodesulfovibrio sp. TaxID=2035812 RepID=UPI003D0B009C